MDKCQKAFEEIKKILMSDILSPHYDPNAEIVLTSDASNYDLRAVILLKYDDVNVKTVTHASRLLLPQKKETKD